MEKFMAEVTFEGNLDYLPIRGVNEKSALRKATKIYEGVEVHCVIPKDQWLIDTFGAVKSPTLIMNILSDFELEQGLSMGLLS